MKHHSHHKLTPESRRELFGSLAWKEEMDKRHRFKLNMLWKIEFKLIMFISDSLSNFMLEI